MDCDNPRDLKYQQTDYINYLDMAFVYLMYFITVQVASLLTEPKVNISNFYLFASFNTWYCVTKTIKRSQ